MMLLAYISTCLGAVLTSLVTVPRKNEGYLRGKRAARHGSECAGTDRDAVGEVDRC